MTPVVTTIKTPAPVLSSTETTAMATELTKKTYKPVKILLYYPDFGAMGGIERYILQVAGTLKENPAFEPIVACSHGTTFHHRLKKLDIKTHGISTTSQFANPNLRPFDHKTKKQLAHVLELEKPDIVHVHIGQKENLWFKKLGFPVVYTFHGYSSLYNLSETRSLAKRVFKKTVQRPAFRAMAEQLDSLLFVSRSEQKRMQSELYLPKQTPGEVLNNGIDIKTLKQTVQNGDLSALRASLNIPSGARCISHINRLDSNKNPLLFLTLAERLLSETPNENPGKPFYFLIAGDGPLRKAVQEHVENSRFKSRFRILGYRADVYNIIALSEITIHLPFLEGFGLGILESMALGVPCLAHNTGGITEILNFNKAEQLRITPNHDGNTDELLQKLSQLLNQSQAERNTLVNALQSRAEDFSHTRMMAQLEEVYHNVHSR